MKVKIQLEDGTIVNAEMHDDELTKLCKKEEVMWFPENGEEAWYVDAHGDVEAMTGWRKSSNYEMFSHKLGHIFKTKEEAEKHLTLIDAKYLVRKRIAELNDGWVPDWNEVDQKKYTITRNNADLVINTGHYSKIQPNWMYLKSRELAKQLIKELEPELRLILEE